MKILIKKYTEGNETLESLHFKDDDDKDYLVMPFYVNDEVEKAHKSLKFGVEYLPQMLQEIYDVGKRGEELKIDIEEIKV